MPGGNPQTLDPNVFLQQLQSQPQQLITWVDEDITTVSNITYNQYASPVSAAIPSAPPAGGSTLTLGLPSMGKKKPKDPPEDPSTPICYNCRKRRPEYYSAVDGGRSVYTFCIPCYESVYRCGRCHCVFDVKLWQHAMITSAPIRCGCSPTKPALTVQHDLDRKANKQVLQIRSKTSWQLTDSATEPTRK